MKTTTNKILARLTGITIGLALFAGAAGVAKAQFKPANDDGIAASPKLRQQLDERNASQKIVGATMAPMSCPKCKDAYSTVTDRTARGANKPLITVARHLCGGCETTIATEGHGKAKRDVATHKCNAGDSLACCLTNKGH